jgi:hypothetical protein
MTPAMANTGSHSRITSERGQQAGFRTLSDFSAVIRPMSGLPTYTGRYHRVKWHGRVFEPAADNAIENEALGATYHPTAKRAS